MYIDYDTILKYGYCISVNNFIVLEGYRMRVNIILENTELKGERVYLTEKNRRNNPDRLEVKKYSPKLRKVCLFREVK
jgi:large subunit ribosomal protein L33